MANENKVLLAIWDCRPKFIRDMRYSYVVENKYRFVLIFEKVKPYPLWLGIWYSKVIRKVVSTFPDVSNQLRGIKALKEPSLTHSVNLAVLYKSQSAE